MAKTIQMTKGPIARNMIFFILPLIGSGLCQQLYNTADFLFVSNLLGKTAAAAVGASSTIVTCTIGLFSGIAIGAEVTLATALGAGQTQKADKIMHTALLFGALGGLALMGLGILFAPQILRLLDTPESIMELAVLYIRIYFLSIPASILYNMCAGVMRACGNSSTPFRILTVFGVVNVAGDALLMAVVPLGVAGAAIATVFCYWCAATLMLRALHSEAYRVSFSWQSLRIDRNSLRQILRIGLPAGIQTVVITLSNIVVQYYINGSDQNGEEYRLRISGQDYDLLQGKNEVTDITIFAAHNYVEGVCSVCGKLKPSIGLNFNLSDDGTYYILTNKGTCTDSTIVIPETFNNLPVKSIGIHAFYNCISLEGIYIPNGITSIEKDAFYNCISLTNLTLPDSVISIGDGAFASCTSLESIKFGENSQLTSIGSEAFYTCSSLKNVNIPGNVNKINSYAFEDCTSITSVTISSSVTSIGDSAFEGCSSLETVYFSENGQLKFLAHRMFQDCTSLRSISIPESVTKSGGSEFKNCTSLSDVKLSESLKNLGDGMFEGCVSLKSISIPDSVTTIGNKTFKDCTTLTNVTLSDALREIGRSTFEGCVSLKSISIPDGVTMIGEYIFKDCTSLVNVNLGENSQLLRIDAYAFFNCVSLENINFHKNNPLTIIQNFAFY